jgi:ABC-type proline/glycine betaine transport system permease subunit
MMRTLDASRWAILRRVESPTALPYSFSGAKIAVAREMGFGGISTWRLGFEDPAFWDLWPSR